MDAVQRKVAQVWFPAGTQGSTKDLQVYENVVAITETDGQNGQVQIGTLVKVGDTWRAIQVPIVPENGQEEIAASGEFFNRAPTVRQPEMPTTAPSDALQTAMAELQELDAKSAGATDPATRTKTPRSTCEVARTNCGDLDGRGRQGHVGENSWPIR